MKHPVSAAEVYFPPEYHGSVRTLIVWPLGKEVAGFEGAGMRETSLCIRC